MCPGLDAFQAVRALVRQRSAIALDETKGYLVDARLAPLAREQGYGSIDAMVAELGRPDRENLRRLVVEAMTTNETFFFRDADVFRALEAELTERLARVTPRAPLRIWSAACSTGQEPYSLVMLARSARPGLTPDLFRVIASDLDTATLARAREGLYSVLEVNRGLPAKRLVESFERDGAHWRVKKELQAFVTFREQNLAGVWPVDPAFDLVLIRNVLIYFEPEDRKRVLDQVRARLRPDGLLVLGKAEGLHGLTDGFDQVQRHGTVFYEPRP